MTLNPCDKGRFVVYQVHPEAPHNDVMDGHGNLSPCVVALGPMEDQVAVTNWVADSVLSPELGGEGVFLPECPVLALSMHCKHGRVVANLVVGWGGGAGGGDMWVCV